MMKEMLLLSCYLFFIGFTFISCKRNTLPKPDTGKIVMGGSFNKDYRVTPTILANGKSRSFSNGCSQTVIWAGVHLQATFLSIPVTGEIGLEVHPNIDQFLYIENGNGYVMMGDSRESLTFVQPLSVDFAIFIPAGKWYNIANTGNKPLELFSIYAPPEHPRDLIHDTYKEIASVY